MYFTKKIPDSGRASSAVGDHILSTIIVFRGVQEVGNSKRRLIFRVNCWERCSSWLSLGTYQVTVSRTTNVAESNGYVWSVTFDTPTVVDGVANAGDQPALYANGRMLGNSTASTWIRLEVRRNFLQYDSSIVLLMHCACSMVCGWYVHNCEPYVPCVPMAILPISALIGYESVLSTSCPTLNTPL